jgi:hypothetical protein
MKKILSTLILLLFTRGLVLAIIIPTSIQQTQYRWRNDDGDEATATWSAAANTSITVASAAARQRLRLEFNNTSGGAFAVNQTLEYSSNGGTTWTAIANAATDEFWYEASPNVANGTATTNQMGAATAGTFAAGKIISAPAAAVNLANSNRTEYEWVIRPTANVQPFVIYLFRTSNQGTTPLNYGKLSTGCVGTIAAGNAHSSAPLVNCSETTDLSLTGHTVGDVTYQWQSNAGAGWINFGANADNTVSSPVIVATQFRCIVSCTATPAKADTTAPIMVGSLPLVVDLGSDINQCLGLEETVILDAGVYPGSTTYTWSDGALGQVRSITQTGTYIVKVTDENNCTGSDTVKVVVREKPLVNLGADTSLCNQGTMVLDAGDDGIDYYWSSGQTTQTIVASHEGTYVAFVTNGDGCTATDTFNLVYNGNFPTVQGIEVHNNGYRTFYFTATNPQNVVGFDWDFGDGSIHSNSAIPTHTYPDDKNYVVVLKLASSCGFSTDSSGVHILGINQLDVNNNEIGIFPNPAKELTTIFNHGSLKMKEILIYSMTGQNVYKAPADKDNRHELKLKGLASGMYTLGIVTDKGIVMRKLEILK